MRKFLILLAAMPLLLFYSLPVYAQSSSSARSCPVIPTQIPPNTLGVTCGLTDDPCANRCCYSTDATGGLKQLPSIGIVNKVMQLLGIGDPFDPLHNLSVQTQTLKQACINGSPSTPGELDNKACLCLSPTPNPLTSLAKTCDNIQSTVEQGQCADCLNGKAPGSGGTPGVWTSVGCVYADLGSFVSKFIFVWGVGFAGGISMLCIIYSAFMMQTSRGNAEAIKKAQQLLTSCITGLMVIIFSVFILRLIGVSILQIPGFN